MAINLADYEKNWTLEIGDVDCNIYLGQNSESPGYGISESNTQEGRAATVYFICFWEDRLDLVAGLVGTVDYQAGTVIREDPFVLPLATADADEGIFKNRTMCTSVPSIVGIKPFRDDQGDVTGLSGWLAYVYAIVQAEFTTPPYLIEDLDGPGVPPPDPSFNDITLQTYVISRIKVSSEVFAPPSGAFQWAAGTYATNSLLDVGAAQVRTRFEVSCTRVRMPLVPMQVIAEMMGTVNASPFTVAGQEFPPESVLFTGVNPEPRCDPYNGGIVWDVELTFMANGPASNGDVTVPLSWNSFMDPGGAWNKIQTSAGQQPFTAQEHTALFLDTIE